MEGTKPKMTEHSRGGDYIKTEFRTGCQRKTRAEAQRDTVLTMEVHTCHSAFWEQRQ